MKMESLTTTIRAMHTVDKAGTTDTGKHTDRMAAGTAMGNTMRMGITSKDITMVMIHNDSRMTTRCGEEA